MIHRLVPGVLVVSLLFPTSAFANLRESANWQAQPAASQQDRERQEWGLRLDNARAKQKFGKRLLIIGSAIVVVGVLTAALTAQDYSANEGQNALLAFSFLGGGGVAAFGGIRWAGANGTLDDLERERRLKNYAQATPTPQHLYAAATLKF